VPPEAIVIYDNDCGFCRWTLAMLLSLDRPRGERGGRGRGAHALRPLPLGTPEAEYLLHDVAPETRVRSWHLVIDPPPSRDPQQLSLDAPPARFSAGAAFAPALRLLPRGRRLAPLVALVPGPTERGYRWVAEHRGLLGRLVTPRGRRWADRVIAEHGGPARA
jgi:predicted DCC family thiol-disulfide oxidoreductase YuxK